MRHPSQEENLNVSGYGLNITISGITVVIVVGLLVALGALVFITFRYTEASRIAMAEQQVIDRAMIVEQQKLNREQYWLIYRELRIQTGLMALPEWRRPQVVNPEQLEEKLREHLGKSPGLHPPLMEGNAPKVPERPPDPKDTEP